MVVATTLHALEITDVHAHIIPSEFVSYLEQHGAAMDEGFPLPRWNAEQQLQWMDSMGIHTSVLTMAAPQPIFGDKAQNADIVRQCN